MQFTTCCHINATLVSLQRVTFGIRLVAIGRAEEARMSFDAARAGVDAGNSARLGPRVPRFPLSDIPARPSS